VSAGTWCSEQARPVGVAAGDYACADFDTGIPSQAPWSTVETKENLSLFTDAAKSLPNSLRVNAIGGARGALVFTAVGGSAVKSVQVSAELNPVPWPAWPPPWEQGARLLCAEVGGARNCLMFEHGNGGDRVYVETTGCTVATQQTCDIPVLPKAGDWTRVELAVSAGSVQVAFNGVSVLPKCDAAFCTGTKATASVGLEEPGSSGYGVRYDNVQIAVVR
jgi:hypothetical protein